MLKLDRTIDKWASNLLETSKQSSNKLTKGDLYYIFFMLGIALGRTENLPKGKDDMVHTGTGQGFGAQYVHKKELLATMLIVSETGKTDLSRDGIKDALKKYISLSNETNLSNSAENIMNMYCHAGYNHIKQKIPSPEEVHTFLFEAYQEVNELFEKNPVWK